MRKKKGQLIPPVEVTPSPGNPTETTVVSGLQAVPGTIETCVPPSKNDKFCWGIHFFKQSE